MKKKYVSYFFLIIYFLIIQKNTSAEAILNTVKPKNKLIENIIKPPKPTNTPIRSLKLTLSPSPLVNDITHIPCKKTKIPKNPYKIIPVLKEAIDDFKTFGDPTSNSYLKLSHNPLFKETSKKIEKEPQIIIRKGSKDPLKDLNIKLLFEELDDAVAKSESSIYKKSKSTITQTTSSDNNIDLDLRKLLNDLDLIDSILESRQSRNN